MQPQHENRPILFSVAAAFLVGAPAFAQDFHAVADGSVVVPATSSTAKAYVSAELRSTPTGPELDYFILLEGLDLDGNQTADPLDDVTAVHLHQGPAGGEGPHVLNVFGMPSADDSQLVIDPVAGTLTGTWDDLDENFIAMMPPASSVRLTDRLTELLNCGLYLQIHTAAVPSGEIRGQVVPSFVFPLGGDDVVPPVATDAIGRATVTLRPDAAGPRLDYLIELHGVDLDGLQTADPLDDVIGVHLVVGAAGTNGAHVLNVFGSPSLDDADMVFDAVAGTISGTWDDGDAAVNAAAPLNESSHELSRYAIDFVRGGLYVEVETAGSPDGELRGQFAAGNALPGTNEDLRLLTGVDATPTTGPCDASKRAAAGQVLSLRVESPAGSLAAGVPFVLAQGFASEVLPVNVAPILPELQVDVTQVFFLYAPGSGGPFGTDVIGAGIQLNYLIPPGLSGMSLRLQAAAISGAAENGVIALSEAHDLVF